MVTTSACLALVSVILIAHPCRAQQQVPGLELAPSRLPTNPSRFVNVRAAVSTPGAHLGFRASYLDRPLRSIVASASRDGNESYVIVGALLSELSVVYRGTRGWDLGLSMGAHLYQRGQGTTLLVGESTSLPTFSTMDPSIEAGYQFQAGNLSARPFSSVYLPLGNSAGFSAESHVRGELGVSAEFEVGIVDLGFESSVLLRPIIDYPTARWGHQAKFSFGAEADLGRGFHLGPEIMIRPILTPQRQKTSTRILPAEVMMSCRYQGDGFALLFAYGLGLPISQLPGDLVKDTTARAPTTPVQRVIMQLTADLGN